MSINTRAKRNINQFNSVCEQPRIALPINKEFEFTSLTFILKHLNIHEPHGSLFEIFRKNLLLFSIKGDCTSSRNKKCMLSLKRKTKMADEQNVQYHHEGGTKPDEGEDIEWIIPTDSDIHLVVFKFLPVFSGEPGTYRSFRSHVLRVMKPIEKFVGQPKYGAALFIVRSKIVGPAEHKLINALTPYNIRAFIHTLDRAYMDQDLRTYGPCTCTRWKRN